MKLKDEVKEMRKEWVHEGYTRIIKDFKDYDKITRGQMVDEIVEYYHSFDVISSMCTYNELMLLKKILNNKVTYKELKKSKKEFELHELLRKFLIIDTIDEEVCVPEELQDVVKLAIKECDKYYMEVNDEINDLLIGLMKIYGIITPEDLLDILQTYIDISDEHFYFHLSTNENFSFNTYHVYVNDIVYLIYEPYYIFEDILVNNINDELDYKIRDEEEVIYLRKHDFYDKNKDILKFLTEVKKLTFFHFTLFDAMLKCVVINDDRKKLIQSFRNIPALKNNNLDEVIELMNKAMDNMPSSILKGYTKKEYDMIKGNNE